MSGGHSVQEPDANRPGSVLRAEREALGVSVREVAETLNLSLAVIEAIEDDDLDRLPGVVFARGYVRAYARLLELDPAPLVAQYPQAADVATRPVASTEPPIWEWIRRRPGLVLGAAAGGLVLVLAVTVSALWPQADPAEMGEAVEVEDAGSRMAAEADDEDRLANWIEAPPESEAGDPAAAPETGQPATAMADGDATTIRRGRSAGTLTSPPDPGADAAPGVDTEAGDAASTSGLSRARSSGPAATGPVDDVRRITATGDDRLAFAFSEDCWVEVQSSTGANLYSDLSRAGTELELLGQGPFRILLGYAPGAELTFNGEPVPLAAHTRNNVATLVLGQ